MALHVDTRPFGALRPGWLDQLVLSLTRRMPGSWLGLRAAFLLRRITTTRIGKGGLDVEQYGVRLRLYPLGNNCEKGALFTPQLYEAIERKVLARLIGEVAKSHRPFVFVDLGANVGLFSLIVAQMAGGDIRALAIEPQPGISERLAFHLAINPRFDIRPLGVALADREGEVDLFIDPRDRGGSRVGGRGEGESVKVRARLLNQVLAEEGFHGADVMKVDISGSEDVVFAPFLEEAEDMILPRVILIEDSSAMWTRDLFVLLEGRGYRQGERSRSNIFFYRDASFLAA